MTKPWCFVLVPETVALEDSFGKKEMSSTYTIHLKGGTFWEYGIIIFSFTSQPQLSEAYEIIAISFISVLPHSFQVQLKCWEQSLLFLGNNLSHSLHRKLMTSLCLTLVCPIWLKITPLVQTWDMGKNTVSVLAYYFLHPKRANLGYIYAFYPPWCI